MNSQLIHVNKKITADMIRRETVDNQERIIIRSATMPGDVVMNRILYPREERDKSLSSFNGIPAPLGHPRKDGIFVSASDLDALENYHFGGRVDNAELLDDRIFHDTIINVNYAKQLDKGRKALEAIDNMERTGVPIHTSTGVYMRKKILDSPMVNESGEEYDAIAYDFRYDHNAILINEEGAATPQQGVGLAVNSAGEELELMIVNEDDEYQPNSEQEIDEEKELQGMFKGMVSFIKNMAFAPRIDAAYNEDVITTNSHEDLEMTKEEMQALLKEQAETMQANFDEKLAPLTQKIESLESNAKAAEDAERAPLAEKAKAKGLEPTDIDAMSTNALKVMFGAPADKSATYVAGGEPVTNSNASEFSRELP